MGKLKRKKTDEQYDAELIAAGGEYLRLQPYVTGHTKILFRHKCGHEREVAPKYLIKNPNSCTYCNTTKSDEQYDAELVAAGGNHVRLQPYIKANTKILHRHKCGYEWPVKPSSVLRRPDTCPKCFSEWNGDHLRLGNEAHDARLVAAGAEYIRLEPYVSSKTKILHRHVPCGHERPVTPGSILSRPNSCPSCATHGFDPTTTGHLYLLDVNGQFIKYGITSDIDRRRRELKAWGGPPTTVIRSWQFDLGSTARDMERLIKLKFGGRYIDPSVLPDGWTETLDSTLLPSVIAFIEDAVKSPE